MTDTDMIYIYARLDQLNSVQIRAIYRLANGHYDDPLVMMMVYGA